MAVSYLEDRKPLTTSDIHTLSLASLGGALEFYDFTIFVFFAGVIGKLYFPPDLPDWLRQLQTFGIFAVGYLARPLGGIMMAHIGDLRGRKRMFTLSVSLMAIATLVIGILPTYRTIGNAAPLLLLVMRVIQGAAIGGEAPGGWVFVAEHAPPGRVGLATGMLTTGLSTGLLIGSFLATTMNFLLTPDQIAGGYWRLPFLVGGAFGFGAVILRRRLQETPLFKAMLARGSMSRELPLRAVLRTHRLAVLTSMASTWMLTAAIIVILLMTPSILQRSFELSTRATLLANLGGTAALCVSALSVGALADRFGVRRIAVPLALLLVAATYTLYVGAAYAPNLLPLFYVLAGAGAGAVSLTPIAIVRAFPTAVRFSGFSFSYNVAYAICGGVTPPLVLWLGHLDRMAPAHYVAGTAAIGILATVLTPVARSSH